jgi:hypothetical protein
VSVDEDFEADAQVILRPELKFGVRFVRDAWRADMLDESA